MKNALLISLFPAVFAGGALLFLNRNEPSAASIPASITLCASPVTGTVGLDQSGKYVGALPGWGAYAYPITGAKDSAQFFFNQGLSLYYGYHMKEALASFKEAARIAPASAMTYWAQALSMGPYYNAAHSYQLPAGITQVLEKMNEHSGTASSKERDLITAMNSRYPPGTEDIKRKELNEAYAASLKSLIEKYPQDPDIRMWYLDAVMLIHAWDFWNSDGSPKEWTQELVTLSEGVLKQHPNHPAALHYHIHLTEASRHPEVALPNADKLKTLFPGVAHMVHMSSHEYQRNGLYAEGVRVNDLADDNLATYDSLARNLSLNVHSPHYFAVQTYCALTGGMYATGIKHALRCQKSVSPTPETTYDQYLYMLPALMQTRLGKWQEILADTVAADPTWSYAMLLHHFARGMAYVNTGSIEQAAQELAHLRERSKDPVLRKRRIPFNAPVTMAVIAEQILLASVEYSSNRPEAAIAALEKAIAVEDELIYTEPNDWPIPARQFLGAFLLRSGKPAQAEQVYRQDLVLNPGNGWSLVGLHQSLRAQRKNKGLNQIRAGYEQAFSKADVVPAASVYIK